MNRRTFLKMISAAAASCAIPLNAQQEVTNLDDLEFYDYSVPIHTDPKIIEAFGEYDPTKKILMKDLIESIRELELHEKACAKEIMKELSQVHIDISGERARWI